MSELMMFGGGLLVGLGAGVSLTLRWMRRTLARELQPNLHGSRKDRR